MPGIDIRRRGELQRGVFEILMEYSDGLQAKEILEKLSSTVPPTDFESSDFPSTPGERRYEKTVRFATIGPVKAGWLEKDRGHWSLTDDGRAAFTKHTDPEEFCRESTRLYQVWKKDQPDTEEVPDDGGDDDETAVSTTLEEAGESAWSEIQRHVLKMGPYDFQELVGGLLRGMGYHVGWISPPGPDRGIDVVAHTDPLGISGPRIKVQVKKWADKTGAGDLRSFMATLSDTDVGIYVCTGGFSREAEREARGQEKRRIMLVDLKKLFDLWVEHYGRIPEDKRRLLPLQPVYFLAPED